MNMALRILGGPWRRSAFPLADDGVGGDELSVPTSVTNLKEDLDASKGSAKAAREKRLSQIRSTPLPPKVAREKGGAAIHPGGDWHSIVQDPGGFISRDERRLCPDDFYDAAYDAVTGKLVWARPLPPVKPVTPQDPQEP